MTAEALKGCISSIRHQTSLMKQCLNDGNLLQALKHCSNFLNELRTNQLTPKEYYEIYMLVFDALEMLTEYLIVSHNNKSKRSEGSSSFLADLYELVQYSGNIVPRLYMMIAIGTTYMGTPDAPTKELMKDMIEMCRGVQHPIRGLFLRYYLSQRIKNLLPMSSEKDFNETVSFLVSNFIEMNKLWVRLQHQGHSSERELRHRERKELRILVGSNLVRLSQVLDEYTDNHTGSVSSVELYKNTIFPVITDQIIQCRDLLAQGYLVDVLIQIFPDEMHLATLQPLLNDVFVRLHPHLRKSELVTSLIDRLINGSSEDMKSASLFETFWEFYLQLVDSDPDIPSEEHSQLLQVFIKLSLTFDPENYDNLNQIFQYASQKLIKKDAADEESLWVDLMTAPVRFFPSVIELLSLPFFHELFENITSTQLKRQLGVEILDKLLLSKNTTYRSSDEIDAIFKYLQVLVVETGSEVNTAKDLGVTLSIKVGEDTMVSQAFLDVQEKLCKIIHFVDGSDHLKAVSNLLYLRKKYLNKNLKNIVYTYPTLVQRILMKLRLGLAKKNDEDENKELVLTSNFKNVAMVIDELYQHHAEYNAELALKLNVNAASVADQMNQEKIAYEFFTQAFTVYEESLSMGRATGLNAHDSMGGSVSYQSVVMIANKLASSRHFSRENYESLITKNTMYGSRLLKKQDQCRSVYLCGHLWWWCELLTSVSETTEDETNEDKNKEDKEEEKKEDEKKGDTTETDAKSDTPKLYRDPKRVLECLQKALRIADSCMDPYLSVRLFVEVLNRCLEFHIYGNELVDSRYINGLIELIRTNLDNLADDGVDGNERQLYYSIRAYYDRTLHYIEEQQYLEAQFVGVVI
ncbi:Vacuolar protein sorting-associated protein 35 [Meyerozyma sp. JA9]|nr:Vacuolar protein sorting-associated protein 35 [Meyerozyma sp. JA9]